MIRHQQSAATTWDTGLPCGNGTLGSLLWGSASCLKVSVDCTELWDVSPVAEFADSKYRFSFVEKQVRDENLAPVRSLIDDPYTHKPQPTRLPGGRIELCLPAANWTEGGIEYDTATAWQQWDNGAKLLTWVAATERVGFIQARGIVPPSVRLLSPFRTGNYDLPDGELVHMKVEALNYGMVESFEGSNHLAWRQVISEQCAYSVGLAWQEDEGGWVAAWSIDYGKHAEVEPLLNRLSAFLQRRESIRREHCLWWRSECGRSDVQLDVPGLTETWHYNRYLFSSACRSESPPISLQGPWTCDNGFLPPWKGDYHHNLNTQYSYYQAFTGNQWDGLSGFLNWIWSIKGISEDWTRLFFECPGLNIPMSTDIEGKPVGGWHQHTHSATVGGWLAHFFYLFWRYSKDRDFLVNRAYPFLRECAIFLEAHTRLNILGKRYFALSSSPEIYNDELSAWFVDTTTQYDLVILRFVFEKSAELASELGITEDELRWQSRLEECPEILSDTTHGLLLAPNSPLGESHRHHSHLMAIHPFHMALDYDTARRSLEHLETLGTREWVGYSWGWRAVLRACLGDGDGCSDDLEVVRSAFCSENGFHLNGDQSGKGYSKFTYRPFTLEGNFLCSTAIQHMLLQSHQGILRVFPALPGHIKKASFKQLCAEDALTVSAEWEGGQCSRLEISARFGVVVRMKQCFRDVPKVLREPRRFLENSGDVLSFRLEAGETITLLG
jgi:alpha-L-fucosidase 2